MSKHSRDGGYSVTIEYTSLGTVSIAEFAQALWEDIQALKDFYGISFITGARLVVPSTNEHGETRIVKHPDGHVVRRFHTHHYRPACLDYRL